MTCHQMLMGEMYWGSAAQKADTQQPEHSRSILTGAASDAAAPSQCKLGTAISILRHGCTAVATKMRQPCRMTPVTAAARTRVVLAAAVAAICLGGAAHIVAVGAGVGGVGLGDAGIFVDAQTALRGGQGEMCGLKPR
jgi:hypothetical protein